VAGLLDVTSFDLHHGTVWIKKFIGLKIMFNS
jgi:hypothetical protein